MLSVRVLFVGLLVATWHFEPLGQGGLFLGNETGGGVCACVLWNG